MTICARFDGRRIRDCTRGLQGCVCVHEILAIAKRIAYPCRGTTDESMTIQQAADEIQKAGNTLSSFEDTSP